MYYTYAKNQGVQYMTGMYVATMAAKEGIFVFPDSPPWGMDAYKEW